MNDLKTETKQLEKQDQPKKQEETIFSLIEKSKSQIEKAIPNAISADRLCRVFLTELRKNPKLMECSKPSLISCLMQTAQLGLETGSIGQAYLVPYKAECTMIIGYKGLVALALRSGKIKYISASCVYEDDIFDFQLGTDPLIKHKPNLNGTGKMIAVYAIAKLDDGEMQFDIMSVDEVEAIKARSKTSNSGPWQTDYAEMSKKTVVRRLCKMLPISAEAQEAASDDELDELNIRKRNYDAIDTSKADLDSIVFGD